MKDLMKPRIIVLADYPNSPFKIGDILTQDFADGANEAGDATTEEIYTTEGMCFAASAHMAKKYPHLFQPIPWYAHRDIADMPEYVYITTKEATNINSTVQKAELWVMEDKPRVSVNGGHWYYGNEILPATTEQITTFLTSKNSL